MKSRNSKDKTGKRSPTPVMKKSALGRGMAALLPGRRPADPASTVRPVPHSFEVKSQVTEVDSPRAPFEVEIGKLTVNRLQPRTDFDETQLESLTRSIRASGILQPIVVTPSASGFSIIAGERRFRAAQRAGLTKVPVVLHRVDQERDFLELALIENLQRADLNPIEEADAYRKLRDDFRLTQEEIAARVGRDRSSVANTLRLLKLPLEVQGHLRAGAISFGHAKAILGLEREADRLHLANEIVSRGLSVREAEDWVAGRPVTGAPSDHPRRVKNQEPNKDVFTRDAEEKLSAHLRTKVEILRRRTGGVLRLSFSSEDELIRLYEILTKTPG